MYLKVGSEEGVWIGLLHVLGHLSPEHVVHDTGAIVEVVQPRQQGHDGGHVVGSMQRLDLP